MLVLSPKLENERFLQLSLDDKVYRLNIKTDYFNIICSVKSLSFIPPALHYARWEAKFFDTRVNSLVLYSYYKRKLAVTSAVVVLLCRLISLFLNFIFYSSVNNAQSRRRNVSGSYKYYTCVVFRWSHFGNSSILSFHFFYYPKCETRRLYDAKRSFSSSFWSKIYGLVFLLSPRGISCRIRLKFLSQIVKIYFRFY